jgi:VWFA-related protein
MGRGCGVWLRCVVVALLPVQIAKAQKASEPVALTRRPIPNSVEDAPALTVTKRMVVINVTVHGKDGIPLHGLTARDFEVSDDGQEQSVAIVDEHDATDTGQKYSPALLPPNTYTNIPSVPLNDALNVIVLDYADTEFRDQSRSWNALRDFVSKLPPGARTAVFVLGTDMKQVCRFSAAPQQLTACLHTKGTQPILPITAVGGFGGDISAPRDSVRTSFLRPGSYRSPSMQADSFRGLTRYLGQFPGRKNLIWIAGGFPSEDPAMGARSALAEVAMNPQTDHHTPLPTNDIAVYMLDPVGLVAPIALGTNAGKVYNHLAVADQWRAEQMHGIANSTGGEGFFGFNTLEANLRQAVTDGANYYTVAYTPADFSYGSYHRVTIGLKNHADATLVYRPGYLATTQPGPIAWSSPQRKVRLSLSAASLPSGLSLGAPDTADILFRVHVAPLPLQSDPKDLHNRAGRLGNKLKKPVRYAFDWEVEPDGLDSTRVPGSGTSPAVTLTVIACDANGNVLNSVENVVPASTALAAVGSQYHQLLDLPKGDVFLRLAAFDNRGQMGSTGISLRIVATPEIAGAASHTRN